MLSIDKNVKLTRADRRHLYQLAGGRWKEAMVRLLTSFVAPLAAVIVLSVIIQVAFFDVPLAGIIFAGSVGDFLLKLGVLFFLTIPIFFVVFAVNIAMFLMRVPPIYMELLGNRKTRIEFNPIPYTVPGSGQYFVQTGIPGHLFLQVQLATFLFINPQQVLLFERTPLTNTFLGIKMPEDILAPELEWITAS